MDKEEQWATMQEALKPLSRAIEELIRDYGNDLPDYQWQVLALQMSDVKRLRSAIAAAHT